jgi:exonuclease III
MANENDQRKCINALKTTFFGGWNVRSCFRQVKREIIIKQLQKNRIQIAALSETAMYDSGVITKDGYSMVYSGVSSSNKTRSAHGVAIYLDKQASIVWKESGSIWEAVNERIIMIRLRCKPIHVTIIAIYSPINSNGNKKAIEETDAFYLKLQQTVDKVPRGDMLLIMGDFNARVGKQQSQTTKNVIGPHAVDKINENGQRLIDFCSHNDIIVANTFYQHKTVHQMTWKHPGNKKWHMLDYTLVNKKFRSSVEDVRVYRNAAGAIGTDHHLVRTKLKLHLKCRKKAEKPQFLRMDMDKLKDDDLKKKFQDQLSNKFQGIDAQDKTVSEKYDEFTEYVTTLSGSIFNQEQNKSRKSKAWLTDEILNLVNKKAAAFVEWQNHRQTRMERKYRNKYCLLRKLVNRKIHTRRLEYWDEVSEEIEKAIKQHDPSTAYRVIRQLKRWKKQCR